MTKKKIIPESPWNVETWSPKKMKLEAAKVRKHYDNWAKKVLNEDQREFIQAPLTSQLIDYDLQKLLQLTFIAGWYRSVKHNVTPKKRQAGTK